MGTTETFQIPLEVAEQYESQLVPALFREWADFLVEEAGVTSGQRVLDVACGTGIVARTVADRIGPEGVVGLDLNEAMLTVARRLRPEIEWRQGDAATLPFPDGTFDVVLCQSGLMFFPDVSQALREMARVSNRSVALQVWDQTQSQPAYAPWIAVAARHAGQEAIDLLSTYFNRGDLEELSSLLASAGLEVTGTRTRETVLRFGSTDELVMAEVQSTPLVDRLNQETLDRILVDTREALRPFVTEDAALIPIRGHLVMAAKR